MTFEELSAQVEKLRPALSAEGQMLVDLFMPFCEAQQATIKKLEDMSINNMTPIECMMKLNELRGMLEG